MNGLLLPSRLAAMAASSPQRIALIVPQGSNGHSRAAYRTFTYQQLDEATDRCAHGLAALGLARGCRTVVLVPHGFEFAALAQAVWKLGAVVILIDPGMGKANLLRCLKEVEPQALIAVPIIHALSRLYPGAFTTLQHRVTVGRRWFWGGASLDQLRQESSRPFQPAQVMADDPAAIIFTTGSTGVPKGVLYRHGMFEAQLQSIERYVPLDDGQTALAAFPPFALYLLALGATCALPPMNQSKPAQVDPKAVVELVHQFQVTSSFGSPAFWNRVSRYCVERAITLSSLKHVMMFGAPVSGSLLARLHQVLPEGADTATPYGATEALPVTSITGSEILGETLGRTSAGAGVCVGKPLPGVTLKIIRITDEAIAQWDETLVVPSGHIGEIVVKGALVTQEYYRRPRQTALAKIADGNAVWHRMGDVGYLDAQGRLWFCGRKGHRVITEDRTLFTIPCEAMFNQHPDVFRSALVGVGAWTRQRPVIIVEPQPGRMPGTARARRRFATELLELGSRHELTAGIRDVLFHPRFPVDYRHNAKILREQLARWATRRLR